MRYEWTGALEAPRDLRPLCKMRGTFNYYKLLASIKAEPKSKVTI